MIEIRQFRPFDVDGIIKIKGIYSNHEAARERLLTLCSTPNTFMQTISDEYGILAVVGATLHWPGNMEIWSVTTESVYRKPVAYTKAVLMLLDQFKRKYEIKRFHATCLCGYPKLEKWFKTIGFKKESVMEKFGPNGENFYMMTRVS